MRSEMRRLFCFSKFFATFARVLINILIKSYFFQLMKKLSLNSTEIKKMLRNFQVYRFFKKIIISIHNDEIF
jgi:hypothetical protein